MTRWIDLLPAPVRDALAVSYFDNTLLRWLLALLVFAITLLALRLLRSFVAARLRKLAARTETDLDDLVASLVDGTRRLVLFFIAVYAGTVPLSLSPSVDRGLDSALFIAVAIQVGLWLTLVLAYLVERHMRRKGDGDPDAPRLAVVSLFNFFAQVAVWSVVVLLSLDNLGFDVTALVAGLGVGGIAVGLALQNVLQDTFASLSIILDKPFEAGDFVVVGDFSGTVERVGIKTTRVRSLSGEQLIFGNSDLLSSRIRNYKRMQERRALFSFGVVYQTPADQLEAIPGMVKEIIEAQEGARFDRAHFKSYGASSLDFEVVYYVLAPDYAIYMDIQQAINFTLFRRFEELGIDFAYPTQTIFLEGMEAAPPQEVESPSPTS